MRCAQLGQHAGADQVAPKCAGDQRLYLIPSRKLTVVRQARLGAAAGRPDWSDSAFVRLALGDAASH